jgi:hypothetical protein
VQNCIADGYELVNATDFIVRLTYDPDVSLSHDVDEDYVANLTFSTDIFQCQLATNLTFNFSAAMLVTGTPAILSPASEVSAKVTSAVVALLSGGASLLQQSRADSLGALASCQFSLVTDVSLQDSPTQLGFGSELQYYYRGSVVGNLAIILGFVMCVFAFACLAAQCCRRNVEILRDRTDDPSTNIVKEDDDVAFDIFVSPDESPTPSRTIEPSLISAIVLRGDHSPVYDRTHTTFDSLLADDAATHVGDFFVADNASHDATLFCEEADVPSITNDDETGVSSATDQTLSAAEQPLIKSEVDGTPSLPLDPIPIVSPPLQFLKRNLVVASTRRETFSEALQRTCAILSFPSIAGVPLLLLADSTTLAAVRLLAHPIDLHDKLIGAVGVIFFLLCFVVCSVYATVFLERTPCAVQLSKKHPLALQADASVGPATGEETTTPKFISAKRKARLRRRAQMRPVVKFFRYWVLPTTEYTSTHMRDRHRYGMMRLLFEDSKVPLLISADLALSLLIASVVGVGISRRETCVYLAAAGAFGYLLFFIFIAVVRPNVCRLQLLASIVGTGLGLYSAVTTLASMWGGFVVLGTINQYLSLVMMALSMVQFVATVVGVVAWFHVVGTVIFASKDALRRSLGMEGDAPPVSVYQNDAGDEIDSVCEDTPPRSPTPSSSSSDDSDALQLAEILPALLRFVGQGTDRAVAGEGLLFEDSVRHASLLELFDEVSAPRATDLVFGEGSELFL